MLQHLFGDVEVGDHAVLHRANGGDVAWRAAQHLLGGKAHVLNHALAVGPAFLADGNHRRLIKDDASTAYVDQCIGGTEIDGDISG